MLFASLINHHAVHQIQVPHGNFISYGEKTDRGRVTFFLPPPFLLVLVKIAGLRGILITFMG